MTTNKIEVVRCELPERKPIYDAFGSYAGLAKLKLPVGQAFWPVVLIDGEPSDPDVATSMLARGQAEFVGAFEDATEIVRELSVAALDGAEAPRYHAVVTAAVKIEAKRMQDAFAEAPVYEHGGHECLAIEDVARIFDVDLDTALSYAGTKFGAAVQDDGGRVLVNRWSVGRCCSGNVEIIDPMPHRLNAEPEARTRRRLLAASAA